MEEALRTKLRSLPALAELVQTRINWGARPQGSPLPDVVLHLIGAVPGMSFAGPDGWSRDRVQADCWARTFKAAGDIADTIAAPASAGGLSGLRETLSALRFRIFVIGRASDTDTDATGIVHRARLDLLVWHSPQPTE